MRLEPGLLATVDLIVGEEDTVAEATVTRVIVDRERFLGKIRR